MTQTAQQKFGERTVTITRVFDAPRDMVWKTWTDPAMVVKWFGPRGFTSSMPQWDLRVGGAFRLVMHGPDGNDYPMTGVFTQLQTPERLAYDMVAVDGVGTHLLEGETVVVLTESGGKTTLQVTSHAVGRVPSAPQMLGGMEAGWTQSIDKLGELVG